MSYPKKTFKFQLVRPLFWSVLLHLFILALFFSPSLIPLELSNPVRMTAYLSSSKPEPLSHKVSSSSLNKQPTERGISNQALALPVPSPLQSTAVFSGSSASLAALNESLVDSGHKSLTSDIASESPISATKLLSLMSEAAPMLAEKSSGLSGDDLRHYRMALAIEARRYKHYPGLAREQGWEGVADVLVQFHSGIASPLVQLAKTSGYELLDKEALAMVGAAVEKVQLPMGLQGHNLRLNMPVRYSLQD